MKEAARVFLSIASTIGGIVFLAAVPYNGYFTDNLGLVFTGVVLLALGLTSFYMTSRFYKRKSD